MIKLKLHKYEFCSSKFQFLFTYRYLRLDGNELTDINGLLTAQSELRWLNISENRLEWFDYAIVPRSITGCDAHFQFIFSRHFTVN